MADENKKIREHYLFIHNAFGKFFEETLNFICTNWYPRFSTVGSKVIGTYFKTVQWFEDFARLGREQDQPNLPIIALNPSGDIVPSEAGGKQFWRFMNLAPGLNLRMHEPIYEDSNVRIVVSFGRFTGEIEINMWLSSVYEYFDVRMLFIQLFGGLERVIYPFYFNSFIVLPSNIYGYRYINSVTGTEYQLNWDNTPVKRQLLTAPNLTEYIYPFSVKPMFRLNSITDGSNRYGGPDKISEWRLNASINYDVEIPVFMIVQTDYLIQSVKANISFLGEASLYAVDNIPTSFLEWEIYDTTSTDDKNFILSDKFVYVTTSSDVGSNDNLVINVPFRINDDSRVVVVSKSGPLLYYDHYRTSVNSITILRQYVPLSVGQIFTILLYKESTTF